ncbi:MAG: hypothetical protein ACJ75E_21460, partial [Actinomycetes bacterium]
VPRTPSPIPRTWSPFTSPAPPRARSRGGGTARRGAGTRPSRAGGHRRGAGSGRRRVEEVLAVSGRVEEDQVEASLVFRRAGDRLLWTGEYPPHAERFRNHGYELVEVLAT